MTCESETCEASQIQDNYPYKKVVLNKVFSKRKTNPQKMRNIGPSSVTTSDMYIHA